MRYCITYYLPIKSEFIPLSHFLCFWIIRRHHTAHPTLLFSRIIRDTHHRSRATISLRAQQCDINHRSVTIGNTYTLRIGYIHMLKIRLVSLLVSDVLIHTHCRSHHFISISSQISLSLSFSLILSIAVQEKHHFIIQIRLILNCLKPRTEFKLETARSSPHDRRFSSSFRTLRGDRLSFNFFSSVLFYSLSGPFIVETHSARIVRARCRFPAIAICRLLPLSIIFFLSPTLKYRRFNGPGRANIHVACLHHC